MDHPKYLFLTKRKPVSDLQRYEMQAVGCVQYELVCSWAFDLGWPSSHDCAQSCVESGDDSSNGSSTLRQFCEGSFLRVLLDKLSRMLHQVQSVVVAVVVVVVAAAAAYMGGQKCPKEMRNSTRL